MISRGRWIGSVLPKESHKNHDGAFTLIEVIMALSLTGLMVAVLAGSYNHAVFTQKALDGRVTALILGEGKLAELESGAESGSSGTFPEPYQKFRWAAREETGDDGATEITLSVEWGDGHNAFTRRKEFTGRRLPE